MSCSFNGADFLSPPSWKRFSYLFSWRVGFRMLWLSGPARAGVLMLSVLPGQPKLSELIEILFLPSPYFLALLAGSHWIPSFLSLEENAFFFFSPSPLVIPPPHHGSRSSLWGDHGSEAF